MYDLSRWNTHMPTRTHAFMYAYKVLQTCTHARMQAHTRLHVL